jgi:hypothetical protein
MEIALNVLMDAVMEVHVVLKTFVIRMVIVMIVHKVNVVEQM